MERLLFQSIRYIAIFVLGITSFVSRASDTDTPLLYDLDPNDGVKESGTKLMELEWGLHLLESDVDGVTMLLIGVHGWQSQGYEWVYPLQTMDNEASAAHFFRWDSDQCPSTETPQLVRAIDTAIKQFPNVETLTIVGHDKGGILVSALVDKLSVRESVEMHTVATPLAPQSSGIDSCQPVVPKRIPANVRFYQWRTQHKLDGVFSDMEIDPQVADIPGSVAVTLPDVYRGHRLDHNWAVSWVAERVSAKDVPLQSR